MYYLFKPLGCKIASEDLYLDCQRNTAILVFQRAPYTVYQCKLDSEENQQCKSNNAIYLYSITIMY